MASYTDSPLLSRIERMLPRLSVKDEESLMPASLGLSGYVYATLLYMSVPILVTVSHRITPFSASYCVESILLLPSPSIHMCNRYQKILLRYINKIHMSLFFKRKPTQDTPFFPLCCCILTNRILFQYDSAMLVK